MEFEVENGTDTYRMKLFHAAADSLIFAEELLSFHQTDYPQPKGSVVGDRPSGNTDRRQSGGGRCYGKNAKVLAESL